MYNICKLPKPIFSINLEKLIFAQDTNWTSSKRLKTITNKRNSEKATKFNKKFLLQTLQRGKTIECNRILQFSLYHMANECRSIFFSFRPLDRCQIHLNWHFRSFSMCIYVFHYLHNLRLDMCSALLHILVVTWKISSICKHSHIGTYNVPIHIKESISSSKIK